MQVLFNRNIPLVAKKIQGSIWQLLAVRWKAAKTLTYCILLWRLNALKSWGTHNPVCEALLLSPVPVKD